MMKILCFIGATVYGVAYAEGLKFLFVELATWIMSLGWLGFLFFLFVYVWMLDLPLIIAYYLSYPMRLMINKCIFAKYIPILYLLIVMPDAIAKPWFLIENYTVIHCLEAALCSILVFAVTVFMALSLYSIKDWRMILSQRLKRIMKDEDI